MKSSEIVKLLKEASLWDTVPEELKRELEVKDDLPYINGVGGADAWYNCFIPTSIEDIDITAAAILHDWRYYTGENLNDFLTANRKFLDDIIFICDTVNIDNNKTLPYIRDCHAGVWKFYYFVDLYGLRFFRTEANTSIVGDDLRKLIKVMEKDIKEKEDLGVGDVY